MKTLIKRMIAKGIIASVLGGAIAYYLFQSSVALPLIIWMVIGMGVLDAVILYYLVKNKRVKNKINTLIKKGRHSINEGDLQSAIQNFTESIDLGPNNSANDAAYYHRGWAYTQEHKYDLAIQDYDQAIRLNPDLASEVEPDLAYAFYRRGKLDDEKGEYDKAIRDFDQAISLNPDDVYALLNRGIVHDEKDEYDLAIKDYTQAIRLNPNNRQAHINLQQVEQKKQAKDRQL